MALAAGSPGDLFLHQSKTNLPSQYKAATIKNISAANFSASMRIKSMRKQAQISRYFLMLGVLPLSAISRSSNFVVFAPWLA
jgi:hypothetical protein